MSALVCFYAIGIGSLIAVAAAAAEWAVQGRIATRHLWTVAIFGALLVPPLAIVQHARGLAVHTTSPTRAVFGEVVQLGHTAGVAMGTHDARSPLHTLRAEYHTLLDRVSTLRPRTLLELWVAASIALVAWIGLGLVHWHREARAWDEIELDGVSVHLSAETGPAVLGVLSQRIVLPEWVRTLAPEHRRLMLAHECEHIAARDPQRLALALGALTLMPWNPALWWCAARLRRAIEMDCDARVLRLHPLPRAYGHLLLQVAARGNNAGPLAVPLVNLLRLPSELEIRLLAMARPRTIGGRTALAGAACAVAAVSIAFTAPVPATTRPTIRNLVQAARTRMSRGEHAVIRVGSAVLELDSATVSADGRHVSGKLRTLRVSEMPKIARDTIPSAVAEDSIQRLARELTDQTRRLDSVRAHSDSVDAQMRAASAAREVRFAGGRVQMNMRTGDRTELLKMVVGARDPREVAAPEVLRRQFDRSAASIDSAVAHYYPRLASDASPTTLIWFVADSSGRIIHVARDDDHKPSMMSAQAVSERFPDIDPRAIDFVSIRRWTIGTRHASVAWVELKR